MRENLLKRSQPASRNVRPINTQHVRRRSAVDAKTVSSPTSSDKMALSPPSSSTSDSSPVRGTMKGNIKVRLLLGRYKLLPASKERQPGKSAADKMVKNNLAVSHAVDAAKKRKRRRSSQSDESVVSSSGESDVKYTLSDVTTPRRGRPPLQPSALVRVRARQLVSKARGGPPADKKPIVSTKARPWAPFWHGRLQLPTQSSRSCRKITINRRLLDDSYTSIGQLGSSQLKPTEQKSSQLTPTEQTATEDRYSNTEHDASVVRPSTGSRVRSVGLLNRPLGSRPAAKPWRRLPTGDKTAVAGPARSLSRSAHASDSPAAPDADAVKNRTADKQTEYAAGLSDKEAPWIANAHRSIYSYQSKKGSMVGKHCYVCDNLYMVHHHFMCRVPCCRACARFYKMHCERGTQLDQLTCLEQGK